jgi:hypothetical protein
MAFNFTTTQWQEIRAAVRAGCAQPALFGEALLLSAARAYLERMPSYLAPSARAAAWRRVSRLMLQTRQALRVADPSAYIERCAPLFGEPPQAPELRISEALDRWRRVAAGMAGVNCNVVPHPRGEFLDAVFDAWVEAGGRLRLSRSGPDSPEPGRLGGPTMRYLQAVAGPVLAGDTPSAEGLRKILERYASRFERMLLVDDELAAHIEAARNRPARAPRSDDLRSRARRLARGPQRAVSR